MIKWYQGKYKRELSQNYIQRRMKGAGEFPGIPGDTEGASFKPPL